MRLMLAALFATAAIAIAIWTVNGTAPWEDDTPAVMAPVDPLVMEALQTEAYVEVIVFMRWLGASGSVAQDDVLGSVNDGEFKLSSKWSSFALIGLASADGVEVLSRHPYVSDIQLRE